MEYYIEEFQSNIEEVKKLLVHAKKLEELVKELDGPLTEEQIDQLWAIVNDCNVPVMCFGLRTDFQSKLFPGSQRLFELASSIQEIKHICNCGQKSIINARLDGNGKVVTEGAQVDIGGNEKYEAMCWKCWIKKRGDAFMFD